MDSADSNFRAYFVGIGDQGEEIGKHVLSEFNSIIGYFQKYRDDDPTFTADRNEHPQLTVLSFNEHQDNPIQDLPHQAPFFWATRDKSKYWIVENNTKITTSVNCHEFALTG